MASPDPRLPPDAAPPRNPVLRQLGETVRAARKRRDWSRRELAAASSVSERHIAKLEGGDGNISVLLLARVAAALNMDMPDLFLPAATGSVEELLVRDLVRGLAAADRQTALQLLQERFLPGAGSRRRLALVGLRGAGKTTIGRRVAERLGLPFIRLGDEIRRLAGLELGEIFSLSGESYYRRLEERALEETLKTHDRAIIETGGSIVSRPKLFSLLLGSCYVVWLRARPEDHMQRVIDQADLRPMEDRADAMADLRHILEQREPYYRQAHAELHTSARSIDDCVDTLVKLFAGNPAAGPGTGGTDLKVTEGLKFNPSVTFNGET